MAPYSLQTDLRVRINNASRLLSALRVPGGCGKYVEVGWVGLNRELHRHFLVLGLLVALHDT